jgi:ubiquinone/menaquinone biosynthesis C-methylase UbiE
VERVIDRPELLDGPLDDAAALAGNLRDLRRVNRLLGGARLSRAAIAGLLAARGIPDSTPITLLDVGTGAADIPVTLLADAHRHGRRVSIVGIDSRREVIDAAVAERPGLRTAAGLRLQVADGTALPYPDAAFDVSHASLVLHHASRDEALALLREMSRVARLGVVVNDLARGRIHWLGAWLAGHLLTRNRYTRHDAPLSVRRAYTRAEMLELLGAAGLSPVAEVGGFLGHRYAIAAVPDRRRPAANPDALAPS